MEEAKGGEWRTGRFAAVNAMAERHGYGKAAGAVNHKAARVATTDDRG